jgi:hypothetical protein
MSTGKLVVYSVAPGAVSSAGSSAAMAAAGHTLAVAGAALGVGALAIGGVATAVLLTRAAMSGLVKFSDAIEASTAAWKHAEASADAWEEAVLAVGARNARIKSLGRALRKRGGLGGDGGGFPGPLSPVASTVGDLRSWCEKTDKLLNRYEERLRGLAAKQAVQALAAMPSTGPGLVEWVPSPGSLRPMASVAAPDASRLAGSREAGSAGGGAGLAERIDAAVAEELRTLAGNVSPAEYPALLQAAAKARQAADRGQRDVAQGWLDELRLRATKADEWARRHREAERLAAAYLTALDSLDSQALRGIVRPPDDEAALAHVRQGLQDVLDGAELTDELKKTADAVLHDAHVRAEEAFIQVNMRTILHRLNYAVTEPELSEDGEAAKFTVTGHNLGDASVVIELSEHDVMARVQAGPSGWDERRTGAWRQDWAEIERRFTAEGLTSQITEFPGLVAVAAAQATAASAAHAAPDGENETLPAKKPRRDDGGSPRKQEPQARRHNR